MAQVTKQPGDEQLVEKYNNDKNMMQNAFYLCDENFIRLVKLNQFPGILICKAVHSIPEKGNCIGTKKREDYTTNADGQTKNEPFNYVLNPNDKFAPTLWMPVSGGCTYYHSSLKSTFVAHVTEHDLPIGEGELLFMEQSRYKQLFPLAEN